MTIDWLAVEFEREMYRIYEEEKRVRGRADNYFLRDLRQFRGVGAAKKLLQRRSRGLDRLVGEGRRHLTVEWLVLDPRFKDLFTEEERRIAQGRAGPRA